MKKIKLSLLVSCSLYANMLYASSFNLHLSQQENETKSPLFLPKPVNLNEGTLKYIKDLGGGTGSVHLLEDKEGKKWVLKGWKNLGHGVTETLTRYFLDNLTGINSLENNFSVHTALPIAVKNILPREVSSSFQQQRLFCLAPFILPKENITDNEIEAEIRKHFVALAFLSLWDIKKENMILTKEGLHFIDTGGSFIYRALGGKKTSSADWDASYVSELRTFPQHITYFKDMPSEQIKVQIRHLLDHSSTLLEKAEELCNALKYPEKIKILSMLASRLRHLADIYHYLSGQWDPKASAFIKASPYDSAGTLSWAHHPDTHDPMILLGQRVRHKWWGNLGGKADPHEFLHETAARETKEESGGILDILAIDIANWPSHDLIEFKEGFTPQRFRTYLHKAEYIDPSILKDEEYTAYKWVPIQSILNALKESSFIEEEGHQTLTVEGCILHPPFLKSLQQKEIQDWLQTLVKGQPVPLAHTQGIYGHNLPSSSHYTFFNPEEAQAELIQGFGHSKAIRMAQEKPSLSLDQGPSHHMLNYLAKTHNIPHTVSDLEKIKTLYSLKDDQASLAHRIIEEEKNHPDRFVMYHGLRSDIWLTYRILSHLRNFWEGTPIQTAVLRSSEIFFDKISNAADLQAITEWSMNYNPAFTAAGISCNPTLFSNFQNETSETIRYFLNNASLIPPKNSWDIIRATFNELGLSYHEINEKNEKLYDRTFPSLGNSKAGALLQFFIPKKDSQHLTYISASLGKWVYKNGVCVTNPAEILDQIAKGEDPKLSWEYNKIQTRLHANLSKYSNVVIKDYFSNNQLITPIDEEIKKFLTPYLASIGTQLIKNITLYKQPVLFQKVSRDSLGIADWEMQNILPPALQAYFRSDLIALKHITDETPEAVRVKGIHPGTLEEVSISEKIISVVKFLTDKQILSLQNHIRLEDSLQDIEILFPLLKQNPEATKRAVDLFLLPNADDCHTSLYEIEDIFNLIKDSKDIAQLYQASKDLFNFTKSFIQHDIDIHELPQDSLKSILNILSLTENPLEIVKATKLIILPEMTSYDVYEALTTLSSSKDPLEIVKATKTLITSRMTVGEHLDLLKTFSSASQPLALARRAQHFMLSNMSVWDRITVLELLEKTDNASELDQAAKMLITPTMNKIDIITLLQKLSSLNIPFQVASNIKVLITPEMTARNIVTLLEIFSRPQTKEELQMAGQELISNKIYGREVVNALNILSKTVDPLKITKAALEINREGQYGPEFTNIIEILSKIQNPLETAREIKELLVPNMRTDHLIHLINKVSQLENIIPVKKGIKEIGYNFWFRIANREGIKLLENLSIFQEPQRIASLIKPFIHPALPFESVLEIMRIMSKTKKAPQLAQAVQTLMENEAERIAAVNLFAILTNVDNLEGVVSAAKDLFTPAMDFLEKEAIVEMLVKVPNPIEFSQAAKAFICKEMSSLERIMLLESLEDIGRSKNPLRLLAGAAKIISPTMPIRSVISILKHISKIINASKLIKSAKLIMLPTDDDTAIFEALKYSIKEKN